MERRVGLGCERVESVIEEGEREVTAGTVLASKIPGSTEH